MKYFPEQNIPAVLSKDQQLTDFLTKQQRQNEQTQMKESLDTLIGKNIGESMYEPIQKAKAAMNYPYSGLNTIIEGQEGTNRKSFAQLMFLYGKQNGRFSSFHSPIIADCSLLKIILFMIWICMYSEKSSTADCAAVWWKKLGRGCSYCFISNSFPI
ncbi:MAG: hypothetical protein ACLRL6_06415 [Clostridium sp.]